MTKSSDGITMEGWGKRMCAYREGRISENDLAMLFFRDMRDDLSRQFLFQLSDGEAAIFGKYIQPDTPPAFLTSNGAIPLRRTLCNAIKERLGRV